MNILLISHLFYPNIGGVEIAVANLAKHFQKKGHRVEVVTSRWPKTLSKFDYANGIRITRLPFRLPSLNSLSLLKFLIRAIECTSSLHSITKTSRFDLINLHYVSENGLYATMLSYFKKLPLITSIHGADIEDFSFRNKLNKYLVGLTLKRSARIIANSNALFKETTKIFGEELLSKSIVAGNGVNLSEFDHLVNGQNSLSPFILGIGRFVHKKGFDILIKAFSLVINRFPDLKLVLVGDGIERSRLETLSRELGLDRSVFFNGQLAHEDVLKILTRCEFFVLPSRKEPFGIVNLEAMAAKRAVIAMDVGGVSEYLQHGKNGLLVKDHKPEALADAIIFLLENQDLARHLGTNGRRIVESNFTWEIIADRYLEVFQSVV